jgi:hypothetical protein
MQVPLTDYDEKREQSRVIFEKDRGQKTAETTPVSITSTIEELAAELSADPPRFVPVIQDPYGLYGWCSDGVEEKIRRDGGAIRFGWAIWENPRLFLTAEFHAVWMDKSGALFDITPKPQGETRIVFAPDPSYEAAFDFDHRPLNKLKRTYAPLVIDFEARIAAFSETQRAYEERRAARAALTLIQWLESKARVDQLAPAIDAFLSAVEAFNAKQDTFQNSMFEPDVEYIRLMRAKAGAFQHMRAVAREYGF